MLGGDATVRRHGERYALSGVGGDQVRDDGRRPVVVGALGTAAHWAVHEPWIETVVDGVCGFAAFAVMAGWVESLVSRWPCLTTLRHRDRRHEGWRIEKDTVARAAG